MSEPDPESLPIGGALRHLRQRLGLTQTAAAGSFEGSPDFRTLSHWETARKAPSLPLLARYLAALGLSFHDLQDALDQVAGWDTGQRVGEITAEVERLAGEVEDLAGRVDDHAGRVDEVERLIEQVAERLAGRVLELEQQIRPAGEPAKPR